MTREIREDGKKLVKYFEEYRLSKHIMSDDQIVQIKRMHKKLFGLLTFYSEVKNIEISKRPFDEQCTNYLDETISDLMQSMFCWANGAYKPGRMLIRSSIETFIKSTVGNKDKTVFSDKSLYSVFDKAKKSDYFSSDLKKDYYNKIHTNYKTLCRTTHSASNLELFGLSCMNHFPLYIKKESDSFFNVFIDTSEAFLGTLMINNYQTVYEFHSLNQSNFLGAMDRKTKSDIHSNVNDCNE